MFNKMNGLLDEAKLEKKCVEVVNEMCSDYDCSVREQEIMVVNCRECVENVLELLVDEDDVEEAFKICIETGCITDSDPEMCLEYNYLKARDEAKMFVEGFTLGYGERISDTENNDNWGV